MLKRLNTNFFSNTINNIKIIINSCCITLLIAFFIIIFEYSLVTFLYFICFENLLFCFFLIILVNYLTLKFVVFSVVFPGSSNIITQIVAYNNNKQELEEFRKCLIELEDLSFLKLNNSNINKQNNYIANYIKLLNNLKLAVTIINKKLDIYSLVLLNTNNKADRIKIFYNLLKNFNEEIVNSSIIHNLELLVKEYEISLCNNVCSHNLAIIKRINFKSEDLDIFIQSILTNKNKILIYINQYLFYGGLINKTIAIYFIFNSKENIFSNKYVLNYQFKIKYNFKDIKISNTHDRVELDAVIIESKKQNLNIHKNLIDLFNNINNKYNQFESKNLVILCTGNGGSYESYFYKNDKIIDFYLGLNNNIILLWNYRGYGLSYGTPCVKNLNHDVNSVVNFMVTSCLEFNSNNQWKSIVIHGCSIGGLAATFSIINNKYIDVCYIDRSFKDLISVCNNYFCSNLIKKILKLYNFKKSYSSNILNIEKYLNNLCNKKDIKKVNIIYSFDFNDNVIPYTSSFKKGLIKSFILKYTEFGYFYDIRNYINKDKLQTIAHSIKFIETFIVNNENNLNNNIKTKSDNVIDYSNKLLASNLNVLSVSNFDSKNSSLIIVINLIKSFKKEINRLISCDISLFNIIDIKNNNNNNNNNNCLYNNCSYDFLNYFYVNIIHYGKYNKCLNDFKKETYKNNIVNNLKETYLLINNIVLNIEKLFKDLDVIISSSYNSNINISILNNIENMNMIDNNVFKNFVYEPNTSNEAIILANSVKNIIFYLVVIKQNLEKVIDIYLNFINDKNCNDFLNNDFRYNFIKMDCGHNGPPSNNNLNTLLKLLMKSKLINSKYL